MFGKICYNGILQLIVKVTEIIGNPLYQPLYQGRARKKTQQTDLQNALGIVILTIRGCGCFLLCPTIETSLETATLKQKFLIELIPFLVNRYHEFPEHVLNILFRFCCLTSVLHKVLRATCRIHWHHPPGSSSDSSSSQSKLKDGAITRSALVP